MKIPKIADALSGIDADLVSESAKERGKAKKPWIKWSLLSAACLCVALLAGVIVVPMMLDQDDSPILQQSRGEAVSFGDLDRNYKNTDVVAHEIAIEWPDEYLTVVEKHSRIIWSQKEYSTMQIPVAPEHLSEKLGNYLEFEVRRIEGVDPAHAIALGIDGVYYNYRCYGDFDKAPATLGELFDQYNFAQLLELNRFYKMAKKFDTQGYYALSDDAYIIEVLSACRDATLYENCNAWQTSEEYLSFTVTSDRLGTYKLAMYITTDGYLWTNAFSYAYVYEIGTEAAGKIIDYAMANSVEKPVEPFEPQLVGTLVEIKDGYAYIDDSIMCVDPEEGMIFRVSCDDLRIKRCIDYADIGVGDLVVVEFRGGIDLEDGNLILNAHSIEQAYISDGDWYVPE